MAEGLGRFYDQYEVGPAPVNFSSHQAAEPRLHREGVRWRGIRAHIGSIQRSYTPSRRAM